MASTDFAFDVDGFAFKNHWTVEPSERELARQIVEDALPAATAMALPIITAALPLVIATGGPLLALAGGAIPVLPFIAPYLLEKTVDGIAEAFADASRNRCAGMAFAAADYHRLQWIVPRGSAGSASPTARDANGTDASEWLRRYIWDRQLDSHRADLPRYVSWMALRLLLGNIGAEWVTGQSRDELLKLSAKLAAGEATPIGLVGKSGSKGAEPFLGHVVVATSLRWLAPHWCIVNAWDNELPGAEQSYEVDARSADVIVRVNGSTDYWQGLFCAGYTPKRPTPAIVLGSAVAFAPPKFSQVRGDVVTGFDIVNRSFGDLEDFAPAVVDAGGLVSASDVFGTLTSGTQASTSLTITSATAGRFSYSPRILLRGTASKATVIRRVPMPDGSDPIGVPFQFNPRLRIASIIKSAGACTPPPTEGNPASYGIDESVINWTQITSVDWRATGAVALTITAANLVIAVLPPAQSSFTIEVVAHLADGTDALGLSNITVIDARTAGRWMLLCELSHAATRRPFPDPRFNPAIDPVRTKPFADRLAAALQPGPVKKELQAMSRAVTRAINELS